MANTFIAFADWALEQGLGKTRGKEVESLINSVILDAHVSLDKGDLVGFWNNLPAIIKADITAFVLKEAGAILPGVAAVENAVAGIESAAK